MGSVISAAHHEKSEPTSAINEKVLAACPVSSRFLAFKVRVEIDRRDNQLSTFRQFITAINDRQWRIPPPTNEAYLLLTLIATISAS
jgi:hypothetical protein